MARKHRIGVIIILTGILKDLGKNNIAIVHPIEPMVKINCSASPSQPNQPVRK